MPPATGGWIVLFSGERARLTPERTALVFVPTCERFSYAELDARAARAAAAWRGPLGLAKGDRIGLLAHNRPEFLDCFFAAGKSGIVVVPLGTLLTAHELEHIVRDSGMRMLIYDGAFAEVVRKVVGLAGRLVRIVLLRRPAETAAALAEDEFPSRPGGWSRDLDGCS